MNRRPKYRNKKTTVDGITFDSKKEAERYQQLVLLKRAGKISRLKRQPKFYLQIQGVPICYDSKRQATYSADFQYLEIHESSTQLVIEDVKSGPTKTPLYKLKKAIMRAMGYDIREV